MYGTRSGKGRGASARRLSPLARAGDSGHGASRHGGRRARGEASGAAQPYVAGFDLSPGIVDLMAEGFIDCTIDQQPYAQGFYPVVQLALYLRYGLLPSSLDAGAAFIDRSNLEAVRRLSHHAIR